MTFAGAGANTVTGNLFAGTLSPDSDRTWIHATTNVTASMPGAAAAFGELTMTSPVNQPVDVDARRGPRSPSVRRSPTPTTRLMGALQGPSTFTDPNGSPYPALGAMGASVGPKDLFVEINSMRTVPGQTTTYGSATRPFPLPNQGVGGVVTDSVGHDHRPSPTTLALVGDALFRAGVRVHFDVGLLEGSGYRVNNVFQPFPAATPGDAVVPTYPDPSTYFIHDGATGAVDRRVACVVNDAAGAGRLEVRIPDAARRV